MASPASNRTPGIEIHSIFDDPSNIERTEYIGHFGTRIDGNINEAVEDKNVTFAQVEGS